MRPRMSFPHKGNKKYIDWLTHPVYDTEETAMPWECNESKNKYFVMMPKRKMNFCGEL